MRSLHFSSEAGGAALYLAAMYAAALLCVGLLHGTHKAPSRRDALALAGRATGGLAALALGADAARAA